jgi:two-component system, NtrC family, nitrogen regulation sensor histidine kinase NtrY
MSKKHLKNLNQNINKNYLQEAQKLSHDIKAPLMILRGSFVENSDHAPTEQLIRKSVERLYEMSREYLQGLDSSDVQILESISIASMKNILKARLAQAPLLAQSHQIHCTPKFYNFVGLQRLALNPPYSDFIQGRRDDFARIFDNLILNALEAAAGHRTTLELRATVYVDEQNLKIEFQDNGMGCSETERSALLKAGYKSKKPGGRGLGLSSARISIESWGGTLNFESSVGKGSVVTLSLPLQQKPLEHEIN